MGLGKTVQTLAHLLLEKQSGRMKKASLIVVPTSLIGNWRREIEQFSPDLKVLVLHGTQRHVLFELIAQHDIILTPIHYSIVTRKPYYRKSSTILFSMKPSTSRTQNRKRLRSPTSLRPSIAWP